MQQYALYRASYLVRVPFGLADSDLSGVNVLIDSFGSIIHKIITINRLIDKEGWRKKWEGFVFMD